MNKTYYVVKLGHSRVTFVALVDISRTNIAKLTDNASFPSPIPTVDTLLAATDRLDKAVQDYDFTRSRIAKQERDLAFVDLKELRKDLGGYVQAASNGDPELILSAGFDMEKARQPIGQLPAPPNVRALVTAYPGRLVVRFGGVKGRLSYQVFRCSGDPLVEANWELYTTTGKTRVVFEGLESNHTYFFRVVALGAAGASPVSDMASAKAA